jgi:hypothetical protein
MHGTANGGKCGQGVSLISWVNNQEQYQNTVLPGVLYGMQNEQWDIECVVISPDAGCANIGQAYNLGMMEAAYPLKIYVHQDVAFRDRSLLTKLDVMLSQPEVGMVGIIGSTSDTGATFFHSPPEDVVGMRNRQWWPQTAPVKLLDCFMFATRLSLPFSTAYEGPHMVAEDYCLRVRREGYQVWTLDAHCEHMSGGTLDAAFWRSRHTHKKIWRDTLPRPIPTRKELERRKAVDAFETNMEFVLVK